MQVERRPRKDESIEIEKLMNRTFDEPQPFNAEELKEKLEEVDKAFVHIDPIVKSRQI